MSETLDSDSLLQTALLDDTEISVHVSDLSLSSSNTSTQSDEKKLQHDTFIQTPPNLPTPQQRQDTTINVMLIKAGSTTPETYHFTKEDILHYVHDTVKLDVHDILTGVDSNSAQKGLFKKPRSYKCRNLLSHSLDRCLVLLPFAFDTSTERLLDNLPLAGDEETPFEFSALDMFIELVIEEHRSALRQLEPKVKQILDTLRKRVGTQELDMLRIHKNDVSSRESYLHRVQQALDDVLEDDQEMLYMHLTRISKDPSTFVEGMYGVQQLRALIEESESLIEARAQDVSDLVLRLQLLSQQIRNTESHVLLRLDTTRNMLLIIELVATVGTMYTGIGALVTGIFGMNLASGHEDSHAWFTAVTSLTTIGLLS
eukprot:gene9785-10417_t